LCGESALSDAPAIWNQSLVGIADGPERSTNGSTYGCWLSAIRFLFGKMIFLDEARIFVKGGDGGNGCMAFRREKFVPRGGPSGGDGGQGGSVYIESTQRHNTLIHFRYNREFKAQRGRHGEGSNCHGANGEDVVIKVPVGSQVFDEDTGELLHDFTRPDEQILIAAGGRGGYGNAHFATSTNRAPRRHDPGQLGGERRLRMQLKLLADVGLVGFPNVGKSTLISRISAARPKIADYPFTTLVPNLGVVAVNEEHSFVVADIPGLIAGAHLGQGLGVQFLRHVERTRVLLHLVDVSETSGRDPLNDLQVINQELEAFSPALLPKIRFVVATKVDIANDPSRLDALADYCRRQQIHFLKISSVTGQGIPELVYAVDAEFQRILKETEG
jgi:GTPase